MHHVESDKWGWKHVSVFGGFDKGSGTKKWKCNHCNQCYNGSYSRVRAHLLGFNGLGVKPCPAIDNSLRETFDVLEKDRVAKKLMKKRALSTSENSTRKRPLGARHRNGSVDDLVARFFYVDGVNVNVVDSTYFREMVKTVGAFGPSYELPSIEQLSGSLLSKEKLRIEKALALARESWPNTGCTILCVNRLDGSIGCFCVNFFVASPRGVVFLKEVDIIEGDVPDNLFINELTKVIVELGPTNVFQVITRLSGHVSDVFESVILSKFPKIFWSHCTSHSVLLLMEDLANLDWIKDVVSRVREIDKYLFSFQSSHTDIDGIKDSVDRIPQKFAPSYSLVKKIFTIRSTLRELVDRNEWKQWRLENVLEMIGFNNVEENIASDEFWSRVNVMLEVYEPFVRLLDTFEVDKSTMGDVYDWRILSLEALRSKGIKDDLLNQVELLVEDVWDKLFSPLHGAAYVLNPKHFGKGQAKNKSLMKAWNATLERYEGSFEARRVLREELGVYWRAEASFGEDAAECRKSLEPVTWWENFGFEIPHLQTLAIKVLSQIPSAAIMCEESWQLCDNSMACREAVEKLGFGLERAEDFIFVRNNLKLQALRNGKGGCHSGSVCGTRSKCS